MVETFNSPSSSNALTLAELFFSLPASNGKLEPVFSTLVIVKVDKRSRLTNDSLHDLLLLKTQATLEKFNADQSIDLWWSAKSRREYRPLRSDNSQRLKKMNTYSNVGMN